MGSGVHGDLTFCETFGTFYSDKSSTKYGNKAAMRRGYMSFAGHSSVNPLSIESAVMIRREHRPAIVCGAYDGYPVTPKPKCYSPNKFVSADLPQLPSYMPPTRAPSQMYSPLSPARQERQREIEKERPSSPLAHNPARPKLFAGMSGPVVSVSETAWVAVAKRRQQKLTPRRRGTCEVNEWQRAVTEEEFALAMQEGFPNNPCDKNWPTQWRANYERIHQSFENPIRVSRNSKNLSPQQQHHHERQERSKVEVHNFASDEEEEEYDCQPVNARVRIATSVMNNNDSSKTTRLRQGSTIQSPNSQSSPSIVTSKSPSSFSTAAAAANGSNKTMVHRSHQSCRRESPHKRFHDQTAHLSHFEDKVRTPINLNQQELDHLNHNHRQHSFAEVPYEKRPKYPSVPPHEFISENVNYSQYLYEQQEKERRMQESRRTQMTIEYPDEDGLYEFAPGSKKFHPRFVSVDQQQHEESTSEEIYTFKAFPESSLHNSHTDRVSKKQQPPVTTAFVTQGIPTAVQFQKRNERNPHNKGYTEDNFSSYRTQSVESVSMVRHSVTNNPSVEQNNINDSECDTHHNEHAQVHSNDNNVEDEDAKREQTVLQNTLVADDFITQSNCNDSASKSGATMEGKKEGWDAVHKNLLRNHIIVFLNVSKMGMTDGQSRKADHAVQKIVSLTYEKIVVAYSTFLKTNDLDTFLNDIILVSSVQKSESRVSDDENQNESFDKTAYVNPEQ